MMNKAELKVLINSINQIKKPREENIFSYFMGFSEEELGKKIGETRKGTFLNTRFQVAQRYNDTALTYKLGYKNRKHGSYIGFIELVKKYLSKTYCIDNFNTWIEQVDHYAFNKKLNWVDGFYLVLKEIYEKEDFLKIQEKIIEEIVFTELSPVEEELKELKINENCIIKVGNLIELSDLIRDDYKQTKYYDMSIRNPSWELFRPSEKDFKFIKYFNEDEKYKLSPITYGRVWRIFSGLVNTILSIKKRNGTYFLYTEIFEIEVEGAIKEKEFIISNTKELPRNSCDINKNIQYRFEIFRTGLITSEEFLLDFPYYNFSEFRKDWQRFNSRFMVGVGRRWTSFNPKYKN